MIVFANPCFFERDDLKQKIERMQARLRETENRAQKWLELTEETFSVAAVLAEK
ncbi:hypothetical protein KGQ27_02490 [Patescibacteria group bacterium]|nr:hypothetical protein [Patescibacteria group bacterium]MDE1946435.1 hypothetical protein [Patescibacteria group bacterium]